jgi:hypothetical protein
VEVLDWACERLAAPAEALVVMAQGTRGLRERGEPLHVVLFSPREQRGDLVFVLRSAPDGMAPLAVLVEGRPVGALARSAGDELRLALVLQRGLTRLEIRPSRVGVPLPLLGDVRFEAAPSGAR